MVRESMKIHLVSLEDGITAIGFRRMAAFVEQLNPNTRTFYVGTRRYLSLSKLIRSPEKCSVALWVVSVLPGDGVRPAESFEARWNFSVWITPKSEGSSEVGFGEVKSASGKSEMKSLNSAT